MSFRGAAGANIQISRNRFDALMHEFFAGAVGVALKLECTAFKIVFDNNIFNIDFCEPMHRFWR